jgi:hypothetical protein
MEKDPAIYLRHILEAIANIETDIAGYDVEKFRADRRIWLRSGSRNGSVFRYSRPRSGRRRAVSSQWSAGRAGRGGDSLVPCGRLHATGHP